MAVSTPYPINPVLIGCLWIMLKEFSRSIDVFLAIT